MSKKAQKPQKEYGKYETGDSVLGKVRGYPPWPGVIVDPADAPPAVLSEQPPGKKATFYCVLFFPMGDYAWLHAKDLSALKRHEIEAFLADESKKRNGDLREGYRIALDPQPWMTNRAEIQQAEIEAAENEQVDQLESENEGDEDSEAKKKSKKRKREDDPTKPAKKAPKPKKGSAEPASKKKSASAAGKPKKNGAKSKTMVESEDEGDAAGAEDDEDAGPSKKKASPPPAKKVKRDKDEDGDEVKSDDPQSLKVRDWRHRLQKTFLSNKAPPKPEAMAEVDQLFKTVETYDEMTIEQLQFSKIGKVMRHIAALSDDKMPPRDEEFHFRTRAKSLVDKWHQILNANKPAAGGSPSASAAAPATNGATKEAKEEGGAPGPVEDAATAANTEEVTNGTKNIDLNGKGSAMMTDNDKFSDPEYLKIREWRHRIQRVFLSPRRPPAPPDMPAMNDLFSVAEAYDSMTDERLKYSKIGVVMRHIASGPAPPLDDIYQFRKRAQALHDKWYQTEVSEPGEASESPTEVALSGTSESKEGSDAILPASENEERLAIVDDSNSSKPSFSLATSLRSEISHSQAPSERTGDSTSADNSSSATSPAF
ncbi:hypothetical protein CVT26_016152 [Gymnopilus dilepis]|uniref:PWWP domain-containing protein n=1 Tax=Gymnopilus dilepis TaxID=231916 RepID=A0A409XYY8_9AGAR|nr:hypothetical protein CVT26_016152 [Gymnopilus dilepis]